MSAKIYKALGLMSGSSLDGLDLALCEFKIENEQIAESWMERSSASSGQCQRDRPLIDRLYRDTVR